MKNIIEIKNIVKKYDDFTLGKIDLAIPGGQIVGLIGENGAGKTTLIKSLLGIIRTDEGSIKILDKEPGENSEIGVVLDNMFFPEILDAEDINSIMKNIWDTWDEKAYDKYLADFKVPKDKSLKTMSKGMRKKTEIATALAHHPKLLILDEPTTGLDPVVRSEVLDIFLNFIQDEEHSILLSTHITSDLEHIADRIIFLNEGKIILNETRDEIIEGYGILKCDLDSFDKIDRKDIIAFKKNRYSYDILIANVEKNRKKYKDHVIDNVTLEDLMLLEIKGEKL